MACAACQNKGCSSCSGADGSVVITVETLSNYSNINNGVVLTGKRYDDQKMYDYIRQNYQYIGVGVCKRLGKRVSLYVDKSGNLYGTSNKLNTRYFILHK